MEYTFYCLWFCHKDIFYSCTVVFIGTLFLLVKLLTFVTSLLMLIILPLQLLSKQIGISGHIHRLVAGSMAGTLFFTLISLAFLVSASWISLAYWHICHLHTNLLIIWQILHHSDWSFMPSYGVLLNHGEKKLVKLVSFPGCLHLYKVIVEVESLSHESRL